MGPHDAKAVKGEGVDQKAVQPSNEMRETAAPPPVMLWRSVAYAPPFDQHVLMRNKSGSVLTGFRTRNGYITAPTGYLFEAVYWMPCPPPPLEEAKDHPMRIALGKIKIIAENNKPAIQNSAGLALQRIYELALDAIVPE